MLIADATLIFCRCADAACRFSADYDAAAVLMLFCAIFLFRHYAYAI